jgi:hypothetical protein
MSASREARLRRQFAGLYPYLRAGEWKSAAVLTDQVVAHVLSGPDAHFITGERALDPVHFEFRGSEGRPRPAKRRYDR